MFFQAFAPTSAAASRKWTARRITCTSWCRCPKGGARHARQFPQGCLLPPCPQAALSRGAPGALGRTLLEPELFCLVHRGSHPCKGEGLYPTSAILDRRRFIPALNGRVFAPTDDKTVPDDSNPLSAMPRHPDGSIGRHERRRRRFKLGIKHHSGELSGFVAFGKNARLDSINLRIADDHGIDPVTV
jgi:hypothetical protein